MPVQGFSLPISFKSGDDLRPRLERNFRHLTNFINSYIPTYNSEDTDLYLQGGARASVGFSPTASEHLTTKDYVDTQVSTHNHDSAYVNVSGDTMTGALTISAQPLSVGQGVGYASILVKSSGANLSGQGELVMSDDVAGTRWIMSHRGANDNSGDLLFSYYDGASWNSMLRLRPSAGDVFIYGINGGTRYTRISVDGNGATLFYGSNGSEVSRLDVGYLRLAAGVALQFNGTTVPRLELGSSNSIQVTNSFGWLQLGPQNTSYCHIYTDRPSFYFNKELLVNGNKVWHAGNDGAGSGLDADLLDGINGASFLRSNATDTATGTLYTSNMFPRTNTTYVVGSNTTYYAAHAATSIYRTNEYTLSARAAKSYVDRQVPGLDFIKSLSIKAFKYNDPGLNTDYNYRYGIDAEDIESALRSVGERVDDVAMIHYAETPTELGLTGAHPHLQESQLLYVMVKAIQELADQIERLENGL